MISEYGLQVHDNPDWRLDFCHNSTRAIKIIAQCRKLVNTARLRNLKKKLHQMTTIKHVENKFGHEIYEGRQPKANIIRGVDIQQFSGERIITTQYRKKGIVLYSKVKIRKYS